jgi:hypothetical protein
MAARAQLEQMRRALPPGAMPVDPRQAAGQDGEAQPGPGHSSGGMYL